MNFIFDWSWQYPCSIHHSGLGCAFESINLFSDTAAILNSLSNIYYGTIRRQTHTNLLPEHPITELFLPTEFKMAAVTPIRFIKLVGYLVLNQSYLSNKTLYRFPKKYLRLFMTVFFNS